VDDEEDGDEGELVDRPQTNDSFVLADLERQVLDYDSEEDEGTRDLFGQQVQKRQLTGRKPKEEKAARKEAHRLKRLERLEKKKQKQSAAGAKDAGRKAPGGAAPGGKKKRRRIGIVSEEIAE
jgi:hypothetical protein